MLETTIHSKDGARRLSPSGAPLVLRMHVCMSFVCNIEIPRPSCRPVDGLLLCTVAIAVRVTRPRPFLELQILSSQCLCRPAPPD